MMSPRQTRPLDPWEKLLTSGNTFGDLCDIYDADFFDEFASHFDRGPKVFDLFKGVLDTGHAYVMGKWAQKARNSDLLKYSGVHLIGAGLSARRLSYELAQVNKSAKVSKAVQSEVQKALAASDTRPFGTRAYKAIQFHNGPKSRLTAIHELASALEEAIETIIPLPNEYDEETDARQRAFDYVIQANNAPKKLLDRNHAMLEAARVFRPLWERCSTLPYRRGRYKHEIGGYDCKAADALFTIVTKLDPTVAPSLPGTAIENLYTQLKAELRSD